MKRCRKPLPKRDGSFFCLKSEKRDKWQDQSVCCRRGRASRCEVERIYLNSSGQHFSLVQMSGWVPAWSSRFLRLLLICSLVFSSAHVFHLVGKFLLLRDEEEKAKSPSPNTINHSTNVLVKVSATRPRTLFSLCFLLLWWGEGEASDSPIPSCRTRRWTWAWAPSWACRWG